jgi:hypothetical protein
MDTHRYTIRYTNINTEEAFRVANEKNNIYTYFDLTKISDAKVVVL